MKKNKVLIVEDEVDLRLLIAEVLKDENYDVIEAGDGEQGLKLAKKLKPDLIISDVIMPKKNGNVFLKELRQNDFGKNIPFIVLTARIKMKDYFEVIDVDDFLEKPITKKELVDSVKKVLAAKTPLKELKVNNKKVRKAKKDGDIVISTEIPKEMELLVDEEMIAQTESGLHFMEKPEAKPKPKRPRADKKILVLEDDLAVCIELQKEISKRGYAVFVAHSPKDCLSEALSVSPDVIIAKNIAGGEGMKGLIDKLRKLSLLRTVPFIVYSDIGKKVFEDKNSEAGPAIFKLNNEGFKVLAQMDELLEDK